MLIGRSDCFIILEESWKILHDSLMHEDMNPQKTIPRERCNKKLSFLLPNNELYSGPMAAIVTPIDIVIQNGPIIDRRYRPKTSFHPSAIHKSYLFIASIKSCIQITTMFLYDLSSIQFLFLIVQHLSILNGCLD